MTIESQSKTDACPPARGGRCNPLQCGPSRRTAVYRLYDRNQRLLYVGIAHDTKRRWRQHAGDKDWWGQVRWRTAIWHTTRLGAAIEEYCAIRFENPIYNKNRDYDHRLGSEPGGAPGHHQPRPWRLNLLASAMRYPRGGTSWGDAAPHFAVVKAANQAGLDEGCVRLWFPQVPELGYWNCGPFADGASVAEIHESAASILTENHGLEPGSFTLSVHDPDGCADPTLEQWKDSLEGHAAADSGPVQPWRKRVGALWRTPEPMLRFLEWWLCFTMSIVQATFLCAYLKISHPYSPNIVLLMGIVSGLATRSASNLTRHPRSRRGD